MLKRLIRSVLLLCALFASAQVLAQNCAKDENGKCIVMEVTGDGDIGSRNGYAGGSGGHTTGGSPSGGGGANRPTVAGSLCRAAFVGLGTISCGLVVAACTTGTFVTIGTLAIPCVGISVVSCSVLGAGALVGGEQLCKP
jgi:hypothetical protein